MWRDDAKSVPGEEKRWRWMRWSCIQISNRAHISRDQINNHFKVHPQCAEFRLSPRLRLSVGCAFWSDFASVTLFDQTLRRSPFRSDFASVDQTFIRVPRCRSHPLRPMYLNNRPWPKIPTRSKLPVLAAFGTEAKLVHVLLLLLFWLANDGGITYLREFSFISQDNYMCLYLQIQAFRRAKDRQNRPSRFRAFEGSLGCWYQEGDNRSLWVLHHLPT